MLARIRRKLERVRASGKTCFGAETHRFVLGPPIEPPEPLPEGFRRFVTELGGSGAGPFYGLLPPDRWKEGARRGLGFRAITIADQGCGNYALLVLNGRKRGRVVYRSELGTLYWPSDASFLAWYERWLDEILWDYDLGWFGVGMAGREADFYRALKSGKKTDGAAAMQRLPSITKRSRTALIAAVRDGAPALQLAALESLAKHDAAALAPFLPALVKSRSKPLVIAALRHVQGTGLANALTTSKDEDIAATAIHAGTLSETALAALLDGASWEPAMMQLRNYRDGTATARIVQWIDHPDFAQRRAALVCLRLRKDPSVTAALRARLPVEPDPQLRAELVEGLGALGDHDTVLDAARRGDAMMMFRAAYVLGSSRDPRARPVLEKLLADRRTPSGGAWSIAEQARRALERLDA